MSRLLCMLLCLFLFSYRWANVRGSYAVHLHVMVVNQPLLLDCEGESEFNSNWKFKGDFLYFNRIIVNKLFGNSMLVHRNYSLLIKALEIFHEGNYECVRDSKILVKHCLEVAGWYY